MSLGSSKYALQSAVSTKQTVPTETVRSVNAAQASTSHHDIPGTGGDATELSRTVSTVVVVTHALLKLLRASISQGPINSASEVLTADHLYEALGALFAKAGGADSVPAIALEKAQVKSPNTPTGNNDAQGLRENLTEETSSHDGSSKTPDGSKVTIAIASPKEQSSKQDQGPKAIVAGNLKAIIAGLQETVNRTEAALKSKGNILQVTSKELDRLKAENEALKAKFQLLSAEHANAFTEVKELRKATGQVETKYANLKEHISKLEKQTNMLEEQLRKLEEQKSILEGANTQLLLEKSAQDEVNAKLSNELEDSKQRCAKSIDEAKILSEKLRASEEELGRIMARQKNDLVAEAKIEELATALSTLKIENSRLLATVQKFEESRITASNVERDTPAMSAAEIDATNAKGRVMEKDVSELEKQLADWKEMATQTYKEYKKILPTYKQADQYRKDALDKAEEIKQLEGQLSVANAFGSKGGASNDDIMYWKEKYEALLASVAD